MNKCKQDVWVAGDKKSGHETLFYQDQDDISTKGYMLDSNLVESQPRKTTVFDLQFLCTQKNNLQIRIF